MAQESRSDECLNNLDEFFNNWPADLQLPDFDASFPYGFQDSSSNSLVSLPSGDVFEQYQPQQAQVTLPEAINSVDSVNQNAIQTYSDLINDQNFADSLATINTSNGLFALPSDTWQAQVVVPDLDQHFTAAPRTSGDFEFDSIFHELSASTLEGQNERSQQTAPNSAAPIADAPVVPIQATACPHKIQNIQTYQSRPHRGSLEFTAPINITDYKPERPENDSKHSWVRINKTTMGLTKRSGKINAYDPENMYETFVHPQGPWQSKSFQFIYAPHGELSMPTYSVEQIKQFIYEHPISADCKLRLWIQKCAADSARRYPTSTLNRCRFANCPIRDVLRNDGTMIAGHYRVCVDEKSLKYGQRVDPYKTTAYFHLYCFEKFMDVPDICRLPNVEVLADLRQFQTEPKSKFNASLAGERAGAIAERFIESCRRQKTDAQGRRLVRYLDDYCVYPQHRGDGWYEETLSYHMIKDKEANRAASSKHALAARAQKFSQIQHNLGNLDVFALAKLAERKPARQPIQRKRKRTAALDDGQYDSDDSDLLPRRRRRRRAASNTSSSYAAPAALPSVITPLRTQPLAPKYPSDDFFSQESTHTAPPLQHQHQHDQNRLMYPEVFDDSQDADIGLFVD